MKKIFSILCFAFLACGTIYADLTGKKIYIDPGHGTYTGDDRLMDCIGIPKSQVRDGYGFSESHTNLWKSEEVAKKLQAAGATVKMSRTQNGVSPGLSTRATEAQNFGADYFLSIHSNAGTLTSNYPALFYKGKGTGEWVNSDSKERCQKLWSYVWEIFEKKFETKSYYTIDQMCIHADVDFWKGDYGVTTINGTTYYGYYGVLRHGRPGLLSEGYFHTVQPSRHRALNADYCRQEGVRYYRALASYYGHAAETNGYIMGMVKNQSKKMENVTDDKQLSENSWGFMVGVNCPDQYAPINGAKAILYNASNEKIAEYTCDSYYNGVFVFNDLTPGTYYVEAIADGFKPMEKQQVVVKANETTYPIIKLISTTDTGNDNPVINPDDNDISTGEVIAGTLSDGTALWTKKDADVTYISGGNQNRSMTYYDGKLYVADNSGKFHVVDASNGSLVTSYDYSDAASFNRNNIRMTSDGQLLVGNSGAGSSTITIYTSDKAKGGATKAGAAPIGGRTDFFYTYGTWQSGYAISLANVNSNITKIAFDGGAIGDIQQIENTDLPTGTAAKAIPAANGKSFYATAQNAIPTRHSLATGAKLSAFGEEQPAKTVSGVGVFALNGHTYMLTPVDEFGQFDVWDITEDLSKAKKLYTKNPSLGTTKNGAATIDFATYVSGNDAYVYVLAPNNGVVAYKFTFTPAPTSLDNVESTLQVISTVDGVCLHFEGEQNIEIYTANGALVHSNIANSSYECSLQSGLYIIRVGNKIVKFLK